MPAVFSFSIENKNSSILWTPSVVVFAAVCVLVATVETVVVASAPNDPEVEDATVTVVEVVVVSGATGSKLRR